MTTTLKAGIIGLGVGVRHAQGYSAHPDCEVTALCDLSEERLQEIGMEYPGVRLTTEAAEVLDDPDIDVVSIASYDGYHYEQVVRAIRNDKHILVEKPLCLKREEAIEIRRLLAEKPDLRFSSNLVLRTVPRFQELKKLIANGELGDLFLVEGDYNYGRINKLTEGWRGQAEFYSVVYGGGVHIVDLLQWLAGDRITEVAAFGTAIATRGSAFRYDDTVVAVLKFQSGMIGKLSANFACVYPHYHALKLYGTKATFVNDRETAALIESRDPATPAREISSAYPAPDKSALIRNFVDVIRGDADPLVNPDAVFQAMSVCFAIQKAVQNGGSVVVEYL